MIWTALLQVTCYVFGGMLFLLSLTLFCKSSFEKLSKACNRSYSTRRMLKPLEVPRACPSIFAGSRVFFALIAIASALSLYYVSRFYKTDVISRGFTSNIHMMSVADSAAESIRIFLMLSLAVSFAVGVFSFVSPAFFTRLNVLLNTWVSTRKMAKGFDVPMNIDPVLLQFRIPIAFAGLIVSVFLVAASYGLS